MISMCCPVLLLNNQRCSMFLEMGCLGESIANLLGFVYYCRGFLLWFCRLCRCRRGCLLFVGLFVTFFLLNLERIGFLVIGGIGFIFFVVLFFSFVWILLLLLFCREKFVHLVIFYFLWFSKTFFYLNLVIK